MKFAISLGSYYQYLADTEWAPASHLKIEAKVETFKDGEMAVSFPDSIRGKHMFIFGDTVHNSTELFLTIDAARRGSAQEITVVLPYYGYCRQDKKGTGRVSMGASMMAHIIQSLGVDRIIAIDLHSDQIQGAFQIPVEHLSGLHLFENKLKHEINVLGKDNVVFCSPDAGGGARVERFVQHFMIPMVTMSKHRDKANSIAYMNLLGNVEDQHVILIDDMVDTGGTLIKAVNLLYESGAKSVRCVITHPVMSDNAYTRLKNAGVKIICADTRNSLNIAADSSENFSVVSCMEILFKAIINITQNQSILTTLS